MSAPCGRLGDCESFPVEMFGVLNTQGWLPGTFVSWSADVSDRARVSCRAFRENVSKSVNAFFPVGTMTLGYGFDTSYANRNEPTGKWTPDDGAALCRGDVNNTLGFDHDGMLGRLGVGHAAAILITGGMWKFYVYERYDAATRAGGSPLELDYAAAIGKQAHVSDRGLLTCEVEAGVNGAIQMAFAGYGRDEGGIYVIILGM